MSEPTTEPTPPQVEAPTAQDAEPKTFDADYVQKLRQEAAKYRTEAKANADAAQRLAAAEKKAQDAELKALRSDIAQAKGVPAGLLTGSTEEELTASADALLAFRGEAVKPPAAPSSAGQGNVGKPLGNGATQLTRGDLAGMTPEAIVQAKSEGRLNDILGIK